MKMDFIKAYLLVVSFGANAAVEITEDLTLSGFGSTSWAKSDNDTPLIINRSISDDNCWDCDTTFGLQLDYFNDAFKASTQIVKRPQDDWSDPELEWAYLGYAIGEVEFRAGRLRLPVFLASEYYYVSHAYKYARPPEELYNSILGITAYNGFNAVWNFDVYDEYQVSISPFIAFEDDNTFDISKTFDVAVDVEDIVGVSASVNGDNFKWNFAYFDANYDQKFILRNAIPGIPYLEIDQPNRNFELYSFGAEYELGQWTLAAERQLGNVRSTWYASASYRYNQLSPYILYGETKTKRTDITDFDGKSGSSFVAGLRYDIRYNLSVNVEWQSFKSFGGQRGSFVETPQDSDANMYTVMFSFVF
ncbi:sulfate ABC transporter permease [Thalassotalea sp. M1531]|uniref:Sulfate ABC transporter permease n=1 Tax=Thalassotalea algicola TaxID=2716224 RepID=A0A7Y0LFJ1_9GAMM|nr:sulfate ABC transporter permease [Thalassotalea algicola]NMP33555.1 sulfate ABC transporter permease [Thalassotalea algicola]